MELCKSTIFAIYVILSFQILDFVNGEERKPPNIYKWIEQNSYICDPTLINAKSPKFLSARQANRHKCSCGDPLIRKAACAQKGRAPPKCTRLPEPCMREYSMIFANPGNRMLTPISTSSTSQRTGQKPHTQKVKKKLVHKKRNRPRPLLRPHTRRPKIVGTMPVSTVVRVRKPAG